MRKEKGLRRGRIRDRGEDFDGKEGGGEKGKGGPK